MKLTIECCVTAGIDTGLAIYNRYSGDQTTNVGYAAHFGGALAGKSQFVLLVAKVNFSVAFAKNCHRVFRALITIQNTRTPCLSLSVSANLQWLSKAHQKLISFKNPINS
jgi:hypothetical protein